MEQKTTPKLFDIEEFAQKRSPSMINFLKMIHGSQISEEDFVLGYVKNSTAKRGPSTKRNSARRLYKWLKESNWL